MSAHQVPEGIPSQETQLASLRATLEGNAAFGRVRGRLGVPTVDLMRGCGNGTSRTSAKQEWAELGSAMAVMQTLIAKYRRDGWTSAETELASALRDPRYRITGESEPLEATSPYTILMIEPEETFAFLRWIRENPNARHEILIDVNRSRLDANPSPPCARLESHAARLSLPSRPCGRQAVNLLPANWQNLVHPDWECYWRPGNAFWTTARVTSLPHLVPKLACAFAVAREQSGILAQFSREHQRRMATWQFNLPAAHRFQSPKKRYLVGFHPEAEHDRWRKERPAFASLGVSRGYGAIILPNTESGACSWYSREAPHVMLRSFRNGRYL